MPIDPSTTSGLSIPNECPTALLKNMGTSETFWGIDLPVDLTDIQFRAIEFTIQGLHDTQIAQTLGINRKTLWKWKTNDDDYRQALTIARAQLHAATADRCQNIAQKAAAVLAKFLDDTADNNRLRAAQILLTVASRFKPTPPAQRPPADPQDDHWSEPALEPKVG
jgi:DNA-binding CsgD family transcriptional regulator